MPDDALVASIYARKSTEQSGVSEEARSVNRQIEHCKAYAEKKGWVVSDDHVFVDDGISGSEFSKRPAFLRLMNALKPRPPFQVVIMYEQSRLGREVIDTSWALKQIMQSGVEVWLSSDDKQSTLDSPTDKILLAVTNYASEVERERGALRTFDALMKKAKQGHVTGGRCFGYDNVPKIETALDGTPYQAYVYRQINEPQAEVVREIYRLYCNDYGYKGIAKELNDKDALCPKPQRGRKSGWSPSSVREVLIRPLYRGLYAWNKTKKRDKWGQAKQTKKASKDHVETYFPELRIVPEELALAVDHRMQKRQAETLRNKDGRLLGRPPMTATKYLLSGLAKCSCGGSMEARKRTQGSKRVLFYACSTYNKKGSKFCPNHHYIRADVLENAILRQFEDVILDPVVVNEVLDQAVERLSGDEAKQQTTDLQEAIAKLQTQIDNLVNAIAEGEESSSLIAELKKREPKLNALKGELTALEFQQSSAWRSKPNVRHDLEKRIADWRKLLRKHSAKGRQILGKLLEGRLTLTAVEGEVAPYYRFSGTGKINGLLSGVLPLKVASPRGIEPLLPG